MISKIPALLLFVLMSAPVFTQSLPDTPQPQPPALNRVDWALLAADAGARGLDVVSTKQMLSRGCQEQIMPDAIARNTPAMAVYSGGIVTLDWFVARELTRHHHHKLARAWIIADGGSTLGASIHNFTLGKPVVHSCPGTAAPTICVAP